MNKIIHFGSTFKAVEENEAKDLIVQGMASTNDKDRVGDVIEPTAWKGGLKNFKKNPVILFNHNYDRPIGKALGVAQTENGLELTAKISKAAGEIVELVKDGILGAFSVGFMVKDADYDAEKDTFIIKQAELLEVSVVSVPANQAATFSVQKSFDSRDEYKEYVNSFKSVCNEASGQDLADKSDDALASTTPGGPNTAAEVQEKKMDEKEIQDMIKEAMKGASKDFAAQVAMQRAEEKAAEEAERKAVEDAQAKEKQDEERVSILVKSNAEALLADVAKQFEDEKASFSEIMESMKGELAEKSEEIQKMRESKYKFADRNSRGGDFFKDNEEDIINAKILGVITRKGWNTSLGKELFEKATNADAGVSAPTVTEENFETIVSTSIERDIELELILDPMFRKITMNAASMVIPTMPDAGYAEFLTANAAGSGTSGPPKGNLEARGDAFGSPFGGISMGSKVLTVEKLVSKSYIADETEEDAIIPILGLIRDAMVRSHARSIEHSILLGGAADDLIASPYNGLVQIANAGSPSTYIDRGSPAELVRAEDLLNMRQAMGKYGRRPGDVIYIVSLDAYYDLLDDPEFQNLQEVGARATKITGEIGQVFGSSVVVCDEFPAKADGKPFAVALNSRHFVVPVLRGVRVEQDRNIENQNLVLVATQRRGFDQIFSTVGQVVAQTW